jgi:hypothetical protein
MEASGSFKPWSLYPHGKVPRYVLDRGLDGPVLDAVERRKILSLPEIEPRPRRYTTELLPTRFKTVYKDNYKYYKNHQVQGLGPFWHILTQFLPRSCSGTVFSRLFPRGLAERSSGVLSIRSLQSTHFEVVFWFLYCVSDPDMLHHRH